MSKAKKKVAKKGLIRPELIPSALIDDAERDQFETALQSSPRASSAFSSLLNLIRLGLLLLRSKSSALSELERAQMLRRFIEIQGGVWTKVGQLLSFRRDLLSRAYIDELSRLQDRGSAFPWETAREVIEEALGGPIHRFFSEINIHPIGVGSIGQVHKGRLYGSNVVVAVKVKRPFVDENFRRDVAFFRTIARFFDRLGLSKQMRWAAMSKELEVMVLDELNYSLEADAAARMHKSLLRHGVYAPKVFFRYCTTTTIVLEYIHGVKMSDYLQVHERDPVRTARWCAENRVDTKRVGYRLFASLQRQIFEDNLFHADLHPGNIMLLRNSRFGLIDFGSVGALDGTFRKQLNQYNALIADGAYMKAAEVYLDISSPLPALNHTQIWELTSAIANYQRSLSLRMGARTIPYDQKNSAEDNRALARVAAKYKIPFSWQWLKLQRTLFALDSSLFGLDRNTDTIKFGVRYRKAATLRFQAKINAVPVTARLSDLLTSATSVASRLDENLDIASRLMRQASLITEPLQVGAARYGLKIVAGLVLVIGCLTMLSAASGFSHGYFPGELVAVTTKISWLRWILWVFAILGVRIFYTGVRGMRIMLAK